MRFFSNKIVNPAGDGPSFDEWMSDYLKKTAGTQTAETDAPAEADAETKIASEAKPENDDGDPRGAGRGQVINNDNEEGADSYQKGESVDGKEDQAEGKSKDKEADSKDKVVEAECGKEMGESDDAGKVTEEHTEAGPGDDEHPEPKVMINNDPCYQKGESTDGGKVKGDNKKTEANVKKPFKKVASMSRQEKLSTFAILSSNKNNHVGQNPLAYCEAMVGLTFANLTDEEKEWFRNFWLTMYPEGYVEEMVADR